MKPEDRPKRTRDVQMYLAQHGFKEVVLNKGPGYFCFEGKLTDGWVDHTVNVTFLADMTCDQWLRAFQAMNDNPANRQSIVRAQR